MRAGAGSHVYWIVRAAVSTSGMCMQSWERWQLRTDWQCQLLVLIRHGLALCALRPHSLYSPGVLILLSSTCAWYLWQVT